MPITSYSQYGEDLQIAAFLDRREDLTYIDVGCLWPVEISNTYFFYKRGGMGLCIDPYADAAEQFATDRPRDVFVAAVCGAALGETTYVMHANPVFNTCSKTRADDVQRKAAGRRGREVIGNVSMPVRTLNDIVAESGFDARVGASIDFMAVDVAGMEIDVLAGFDFQYPRPKLVVCEARVAHDEGGKAIVTRMADVGYGIVGQTRNTLYFLDVD